jgi:hypothetical protein
MEARAGVAGSRCEEVGTMDERGRIREVLARYVRAIYARDGVAQGAPLVLPDADLAPAGRA